MPNSTRTSALRASLLATATAPPGVRPPASRDATACPVGQPQRSKAEIHRNLCRASVTSVLWKRPWCPARNDHRRRESETTAQPVRRALSPVGVTANHAPALARVSGACRYPSSFRLMYSGHPLSVSWLVPSGLFSVPTIPGSTPSSSGACPSVSSTGIHVCTQSPLQFDVGGLALSASGRES